jgi:outer membrane protein OmpA-like peptidoglycan-associated protein
MKKFFISFLVFGLVLGAAAQTSSQKWGLGVYAGDSEYNGDLGNGFFKLYPGYRMGGFFLGRYLSPSFDVALQGDYGSFGFDDEENSWFLTKKTAADLLLKFKFNNGSILKEDALFAPYLAVGGGIVNFSDYKSPGSGTDVIVPLGAGVRFSVDPQNLVDFQYQILYNLNLTNKGDMPLAGDKLSFITHSFGIIFNFGSPKDSDNDGVPDKLDKCPDTPSGVKVNAEGCPLDGDGDGIPDYLDKCPTQAGLETFNGCPDTDGDGIPDSEDKCPAVKGPAALGGCPDTDGDGIIDIEDKCPAVKGLQQFNGCPDTDGDGIIDSEDRCPTVKGLKEFAGCPDTDGDGIPDIDDRCPAVPGIKENKGCPAVAEETVKVFTQALTGILFETGKDVIRTVSFPILDNVVRIMKENPAYLLEINGHTDNVGDDAMNLDLSERRAASVKKYLVDKGVEAGRLTSKGFGESMPIADNSTAAGRTRNRRVEFKVNF